MSIMKKDIHNLSVSAGLGTLPVIFKVISPRSDIYFWLTIIYSNFLLKIFQLIQTSSSTTYHQCRCHFRKCTANRLVLVKLSEICEGIEPFSAVMSLYLTEACLDGIEVRTVRNIINRHDVERSVMRLNISLLVNTKLIHKQRKWLVTVLLPQLL